MCWGASCLQRALRCLLSAVEGLVESARKVQCVVCPRSLLLCVISWKDSGQPGPVHSETQCHFTLWPASCPWEPLIVFSPSLYRWGG